MASKSLMEWRTDAWAAFDEIEHAHRAVGGVKPGRRFLTQQLNYAYATLLAARYARPVAEFVLEKEGSIGLTMPCAIHCGTYSTSVSATAFTREQSRQSVEAVTYAPKRQPGVVLLN